MSPLVWTGLLLFVAVVVLPVLRLWDWWHDRRALRRAQHDALVQQILTADPEISQLEACWRLPDHQRQEHPSE